MAFASASRARRAQLRWILGTVAALSLPAPAHATSFYYVGPNGGSWNTPANWSATSGGAGGAGVPGSGDLAILSPTTTKSVTFDADYVAPGPLQIYLDGLSGATVTLNQSGHTMVATVESIGIQGIGVYHQTGGSNSSTGDFHIGQSGGGTGTYILDLGSLDVAASEYIGEGSSTGNFTQNGGTHVVHDALKIAFPSGSTGHYTLNNGSVAVTDGSGYLTIGYQGTATFLQTGGSVSATHMQIAEGLSGNATYDLQSGNLTVNGSEDIGVGGVAVFHQTGGTHTMTGNLYLTGLANPGSSGTYNLDDGTLNVTGNIVNNGTMTQAAAAELNLGGTVIGNGIILTNGPLALADQTNINSGTVQVAGGAATGQTLIVGKDATNPDPPNNTIAGNGTLKVQGGTTTISGVLGAGNNGTLTAGAGTGQIEVSGGTLNAATVLLGSTAGGNGSLRVSNFGQVVIGGGLSVNDLIMDGGSVQVLDQAPPVGEDPMLNRSIVGGYLRDGALQVHAGTMTSPKIKLGVTSGKTGTMNMTGGTVTVGILGAGNDATLTSGQGTGTIDVSGGTLNASTVMLGSTAGGSGSLRVSNFGQVVIGGGFTTNNLIMDGGSLQVLDQAPPAGEDPVLDRSLVAGYLHDGAMVMNAGTATTPNLKVGVTAGKVGTLTMNGGSLTATNVLASNGAGSVITFNGGTLHSGHSVVDGPSALVVGDGTHGATLDLSPAGGSHSFADGLTLSATGKLSGAGALTGNVSNGGHVSPSNFGVLAISGTYAQTSGGTLDIDVGGTGAQFGAVTASGSATLAGTLHVRFVGPQTPTIGQQFPVAVGHPLTGTFASVQGVGGTVSYTGTSAILTFTGVDVPRPTEPPTSVVALALEPIQPNPIRGDATIVFALPSAGPVSLAIHDASGRLVRMLAQTEFGAGPHSVTWDGRTDAGAVARPGVYLVRLMAQGRHLSRKLIVP